MRKTKQFIYLISPKKILSSDFYKYLEKLFKTKKVYFFQLRLKKENKQLEKDINIANEKLIEELSKKDTNIRAINHDDL